MFALYTERRLAARRRTTPDSDSSVQRAAAIRYRPLYEFYTAATSVQ